MSAAGLRLHNVTEAAELLGLTEHMVIAERRAGRLNFRRIGAPTEKYPAGGRLIRYSDEDLADYVELTAAAPEPGSLRRTDAARARRRAS